MLATRNGHVRRNSLHDFVNVKANGKIAMKLDPGDALVSVHTCTAEDDVLLATRAGKCIRFPATDVRIFIGRDSVGVRGIRLAAGDEIISMSILRHFDFATEERDAYLKRANALRRANGEEPEDVPSGTAEADAFEFGEARFDELEAAEEFILTVAAHGFGKRTSAYDYRVTSRGGKGIDSMDLGGAGTTVAAAFPVREADQIVLVTDGGQIIRCPVDGIRIAGRPTRGVVLFRTAEDEHVVSVARLGEVADADGQGDEPAAADAHEEADHG